MIIKKIKTLSQLQILRQELTNQGKKVGFTSGVFDLLHAGHAEYLETAKSFCDVLIVGVNSDSSVKQNKGTERPIISEQARVFLVAALASVDYVFIFSERNNNVNITNLKPDFYIKAGDYSPEKLSSAHIVASYGGEIKIVPFKSGFSSTSIIEKIQSQAQTTFFKRDVPSGQKAIFLDRDGTIIEHVEYLHEPEKVKEAKGAYQALKHWQDLGYKLIVVTNQPGIGFGYFTKEDFFKVNKEFLKQVSAVGVKIDKIYFCPHTSAENCDCRKPKTLFFERAVAELGIDLTESVMIGDSGCDIQFGKNGGLKTILIKETDVNCTDKSKACQADYVVSDLSQADEIILALNKR